MCSYTLINACGFRYYIQKDMVKHLKCSHRIRPVAKSMIADSMNYVSLFLTVLCKHLGKLYAPDTFFSASQAV